MSNKEDPEFNANFWREVVENLLAGVFLVDEKLRLRYVNKIVEIATGYRRDELYSMRVFHLAHEDDYPKIFEAYNRAITGERIFIENRYFTKDGRLRWSWGYLVPIEYKGERLGVGNWIDVTRVKKLEQRLRESEEFYRMLIEDSLTGVYIVQNDRFVYINRAFEEIVGYTREEILNKDPFSIVHPADREIVRKKYLKRVLESSPTETYSWRVIRKDGKVRWVTARPSRITYRGKPAVAATTIDTTQIHEMAEELRRKTEYLTLLNKILRHDIMNDLTVVRAALELRDEKLIENAISRINRMTELIKEIKILEEVGGDRKAVNLAEYVRDVAEVYREEAEIRLNLEDVYVMANEGLKAVLHNLIRNAIIHGGKKPIEITISVFRDDGMGVMVVADNGVGVPDEIKDRIFEEGFSGESGTGLGLFIVKKIVELYGGSIKVMDNKPSGAVFEVRLPLEKF